MRGDVIIIEINVMRPRGGKIICPAHCGFFHLSILLQSQYKKEASLSMYPGRAHKKARKNLTTNKHEPNEPVC
jgi:hypothetical protein